MSAAVGFQPGALLTHRVATASPRLFLIADEVGLGKTVETALILRELASRGELFCLADAPAALTRLDGWVRHHRRKCFWLRWHNRHGPHPALTRLGIRGRALRTASSRKGAWRIARAPTQQQALCNRILRRYGLWLPSDLAAA